MQVYCDNYLIINTMLMVFIITKNINNLIILYNKLFYLK